jgi:hypothetical protein
MSKCLTRQKNDDEDDETKRELLALIEIETKNNKSQNFVNEESLPFK